MGQGQSVEEWKEIFQTLDVDKTGRLNLRELLCSDRPELSGSSVGFLFRFDTSQEGTINFDEFQELLKHLRRLESKSAQKKKHIFSLRRLLGREPKREESTEELCWTTVDSNEAEDLILDRDTTTPAFIGGRRSRQSSEELERERREIANSPDRTKNQAVAREERKTREHLEQSLRKEEGRTKFMEWLFKLADVDKSDRVSASELELVLRALAKDQINTAQLSYDEEHITPLLLQSIMCEYDIGKTGYLTRDEFMVLADLIVRNYDALCDEQDNSQIIQDYIIRWKLGEGASGVVRLGVHKETKEHFAIKIIRKGDCSDLSMLDKEIQAMLMLKHPNVVKLHKVLEGDEKVYFVMELCGGGSIADYAAIHPLSEDLSRYYFYQLVQVVQYCHFKGVVHRDLKLENLLLDNEGVVHVSDFGHAGIFQQGWDLFSTAVGSLYHLSPEQINGECYSGEKTDTWAMGVALYRMVVGKPPFCSSDINQLLKDIKNVNYTVPESLSEEVKDLLAIILKFDPNQRPDLSTVLNHPWLANHKKANPSIITRHIPRSRKKFSAENLVSSIRNLGVVVVNATSSVPKSDIYCFLKCHFAPKELKFSIALCKNKSQEPSRRTLTPQPTARKQLPISNEKRKPQDSLNRSLPMDIPVVHIPENSSRNMTAHEISPRKATSRGISPRRTNSMQTNLSPGISPPEALSAGSHRHSSAQELKTGPIEVRQKARKQKSLGDAGKSPEQVHFQPVKKKKRKSKSTITMEIQLRQGNLSELYKLADKILSFDCFDGCFPSTLAK